MWVVKIGGSLGKDSRLKTWLKLLSQCAGRKVVVVPGGGAFADQVRSYQAQWRFDDRTAHRMAVLAMHQYGWMLAGIQPALAPVVGSEAARAGLEAGRTPIWLPEMEELTRARIPCSWTVTSDSLAAWLAGHLGARGVILVKAATIATQDLNQLQRQGIIDQAFQHWLGKDLHYRVCSVSEHPRFEDLLQPFS